MKTPPAPLVPAVCLTALFLLASIAARADDVLPRPADPKRYDRLAAHSPFAPPSARAGRDASPRHAAARSVVVRHLTVTTLVQDGKVYSATVLEKDTSLTYLVRSDRIVNPDHALIVASVKWAARPEDITVTLARGKEFGEVRFDPSVVAGGSSGAGAPSASTGRTITPNPVTAFHPPPPIPGARRCCREGSRLTTSCASGS